MTQTFGVNANNDLFIGTNGKLSVLSGIDAVGAACKSASQALLNTMIYAQGKGIPYFEAVWIGNPNYPVFRKYLVDTLESVDGVQSVQSLAYSIINHTLQYTTTIKTIYGATVLNG